MNNNIDAKNKLEKIVVSTGIGKIAASTTNFEDKILPEMIKDIAAITGQKPSVRRARKSISGFKIREGAVVGLAVTLRGGRMFAFFHKLNTVILPRIRDFAGIKRESLDDGGNLNIGIKDSAIFPEINPDVQRVNFGVQVTVVPKSVKKREEAAEIYKNMGVPFKKFKK